MQAKDVMTTPVVSVEQDTRVHDVVRLLLEHRISAVPVVDANEQWWASSAKATCWSRPTLRVASRPGG